MTHQSDLPAHLKATTQPSSVAPGCELTTALMGSSLVSTQQTIRRVVKCNRENDKRFFSRFLRFTVFNLIRFCFSLISSCRRHFYSQCSMDHGRIQSLSPFSLQRTFKMEPFFYYDGVRADWGQRAFREYCCAVW